MTKPYRELREKMNPASRARAEKKAQKIIKRLQMNELIVKLMNSEEVYEASQAYRHEPVFSNRTIGLWEKMIKTILQEEAKIEQKK